MELYLEEISHACQTIGSSRYVKVEDEFLKRDSPNKFREINSNNQVKRRRIKLERKILDTKPTKAQI